MIVTNKFLGSLENYVCRRPSHCEATSCLTHAALEALRIHPFIDVAFCWKALLNENTTIRIVSLSAGWIFGSSTADLLGLEFSAITERA